MSHRLKSEHAALTAEIARIDGDVDTFPIISAGPVTDTDDSLFHWRAKIISTVISPLCGGQYLLDLHFPQNYPISPPQLTFITPIYHPNVNENGEIDASILTVLKGHNSWSPALRIRTVLLTVVAILNTPINIDKYLQRNYDDNADAFKYNKECIIKYNKERLVYEEKANEYAVQYAHAAKQYNPKSVFLAIRDALKFGFGRDQAFDLETIVIEYVGLDINKLCKWSPELGQDFRYRHLLKMTNRSNDIMSSEPNNQQLDIFYITFTDKVSAISVMNDSTIKEVKQEIHRLELIPIKILRLIYQGKQLQDDDVVIDCGIKEGSMIDILLPYEAAEASSSLVLSRYNQNNENVKQASNANSDTNGQPPKKKRRIK